MTTSANKASMSTTDVKIENGKSDKKEMHLRDLFEHALKDIYYAEKKIQKSLPQMIKAAHAPELKQGLTMHLEETASHITSLEAIFEMIDMKPKAERCDAIDGILTEGEGLLQDFGKTPAGDAAIIFSCQAVEHYEITRYGSMHAFAVCLGMKDAAALIAKTLAQEKAADEKLTSMAEERINFAAAA